MAEQPYNSLGQILAQGGEIALGMAIANGWSDSAIAALFAKRFEPMLEIDRVRLIRLATNAVNAAYGINNQDPEEEVDIAGIPINPELFGPDSDGKRGFWVGEYSPDNGESWIQIRIISAVFGTRQEMIDEIRERGKEIVSKYPDRLNRGGGDEDDEGIAILRFIERKF